MRKYLLVIALAFLGITASFSQDQVGDVIALSEVPESKALLAAAEEYTQAIISGNHDKAVSLTNTDLVEMGGGADFMKTDLGNDRQIVTSQGFSYVDVELGAHPEFLAHDNQLQTVIPVIYKLKFQEQDVESWTNLYAVSKDEGKTWSFVDLVKFDEASLRDFVKGVSPDFQFPTK